MAMLTKILHSDPAPSKIYPSEQITHPRIMPKRTDINSILIIGAGPIIIGQACEFDYSGAQTCKALREKGYRIILVNSNPATIMGSPYKPMEALKIKVL